MLGEMTREHTPVLAAELVTMLAPQPGEIAVDATFGAGGHARLIAERLGPSGMLVAIDRDPEAQARFASFAAEVDCGTRFVPGAFGDVLEDLRDEGLRADMVLLDLGVSSMQIDTPERGFSYTQDAPLDMRMDQSEGLTAADVLNTYDAPALATVLRRYGEERYAGQIARAIVRERERRPIETTSELVEVVTAAVPTPARFAAGHPAKRVFQALRIAVNDELEELDRGLAAGWDVLRENGRFAGISFHSLEDRRVKRFLAELERGCICPPGLPICRCGHVPRAELLLRGGVTAGADELIENPRARSARLRGARKLPAEEARTA